LEDRARTIPEPSRPLKNCTNSADATCRFSKP